MLNAIWLRWFQPEMSLELQVIAANATFTSKVTGLGACTFWRADKGYRAILTRAASKFPPKIVVPFGVAAPAAGSAEMPAGEARTPATAASVPLAADSLAEALSNE
jgi:hypothetical protein